MASHIAGLPITAVLRAEDLERAREFYTGVLGLTDETPGGLTSERMFVAGDGTRVTIYARPGMPAPQNTTLGFGVPSTEFDTVVGELRSKGVVFEEYDLPDIGLKTVDGVAEFDGIKTAWFKDSEDNILTIGVM
jgi:catechol 2,3-dioxygenase-like lactoylglutathione lyase family enzyme